MILDEDVEGLMSRRLLLQAGAAAVASTMLLDANALASARGFFSSEKASEATRHYTRTGYRRARFAPHVGTMVELRPHGGVVVRCELAAVEDVAYVKGLAGAQDAYVLRFRGPAATPLPEGIVGVRHKDFGTLQLHIGPPRPAGAQLDYIAAINRRIPRAARRGARGRR